MAFVVVTSLLEIVEQQLLKPNSCLIIDDREMIMLLSGKLRFLQAFLEEFGTKTDDPQAKQILDAEIRDVVAEAEGKIESKLREVYLAANRGKCAVETCQGLHQTLQQVVKDVEAIELKTLVLKTNITSLVGSSTNDFKEENIMVVGTSQNALDSEDEVIVGFDSEINTIRKRYFCQQEVEVIPLVGVGGIGKTTLAKKLYTLYTIQDHFQIRAWVVVSKEHNVKEMLIGLLRCILPITSEISNKDNAQLAAHIRKSLMGQKYFIVLDNIWSTAAWDAIQGCFPDNSNGSRILITTRREKVAAYICPGVLPHFIKLQTIVCSWKLFRSKVLGERIFFSPEFEQLGLHIVQQCRGLPLSILVIAGLLTTAKRSLKIWRQVAKALDGIESDDNRTSRILSLSYNYLPSHLKACFLYFGVLPEGSDIPIKKLIDLWIVEGFLKPEKNKSLEGVAESYLQDLITRSLVQIEKRSIDVKSKSCMIHEQLHEICVREAKKENLLSVIDENHNLESSRWVSYGSSHWSITQASHGNQTSNKIRSIILRTSEDVYLSKCKFAGLCFKLLRVLDLSLIKYSHGTPSGIEDLVHLRYLALRTIGSLYKFRLFKLQNLQILIVCSWMEGYTLQMPCDILDLPQLRHLHLEKRSSQYLPNLVRENLQTLYWLKVASSDQKPNFRMVPNLKELGIYIEGELAPSCLEKLIYLHLLEKLKFEMGRNGLFYLPKRFPPNLKKLTLRYTYLPWEKMDIISKLPNLELLKLKDFAFCGPKWEPKKGGFRRLNVLLISCSNLRFWTVISDHFPVLTCLVLRYCWDLEKVPIAFAEIETLKLIVLESCYSSLVCSAYDFRWRVAPRTICIHDLGTKVELPNNDSSEELSVVLPNNESTAEGESVELPKKKVLKALKKKVLNALKMNKM
ncbi:PREDICTED: putative late blight resistance protein homolog R1B-14 isoform X1 [Ipomoea nil]|uniref:putative late blight resistance protein homolog R1B-14 isoform X1 n=1 Tax=Ipomoea nil TaxID=35883 RepID=UPI00090091FE|nr:PREDICTED: putative late blight resistance protein homolog R1B-14 isoform X1 [Ipomoea nil]XP_019162467.1 PREDICTED: putative late blight resistance protein homolog R1B-14 isoform X1 [Ipomoea nil]